MTAQSVCVWLALMLLAPAAAAQPTAEVPDAAELDARVSLLAQHLDGRAIDAFMEPAVGGIVIGAGLLSLPLVKIADGHPGNAAVIASGSGVMLAGGITSYVAERDYWPFIAASTSGFGASLQLFGSISLPRFSRAAKVGVYPLAGALAVQSLMLTADWAILRPASATTLHRHYEALTEGTATLQQVQHAEQDFARTLRPVPPIFYAVPYAAAGAYTLVASASESGDDAEVLRLVGAFELVLSGIAVVGSLLQDDYGDYAEDLGELNLVPLVDLDLAGVAVVRTW